MSEEAFVAAIAAVALASSEARGELLRSVVEVARAIFLAQAASIALLDKSEGEFVFEAVAGAGAGELVGMRFSAGAGIAGHVAATGEPLIVGSGPRRDRPPDSSRNSSCSGPPARRRSR